ncbi:hypothetical protein ABMJ49_004040 [Escherichia coli]
MKLVFVPLKDVFKECKGKRQFSIKKDAYRRFSSVSNEMQIGIKKIAALYINRNFGCQALKEAGILIHAGDKNWTTKTIKVNGIQQRFIVLLDQSEE